MRVEPPRGSASADAEKVLNGSAVIQSYVLVFGVSLIVLTFRLRARLGRRGAARSWYFGGIRAKRASGVDHIGGGPKQRTSGLSNI